MKTIRVIGVPEHFNLPWHMAIEEGAFEDRGIKLQWNDVPEGTGKMCQLIQGNEADLAIILTEGIIKSIIEGNPARIIQGYIASPLLWGIHVAAKSPYKTLEDLKGKTAAISRYGSGSHLMAYVQAQNQGWNTSELQFEIVNNLNGAIEALENGTADYFMWEHFTTKPLVTEGVFRRIDDCPTPWPCFVIAASQKCLQENPAVVRHVLEVINLYTSEFKRIPSIDRTLSNRYAQQLEDIQTWLAITQWSQDTIDSQLVENVQDTLLQLKLIKNTIPPADILTKL
ncbi:MAG: ABC transporter substrate-binding protein [Eudoraea sp.]|nr:ABC transporter substrate-binding protein [Eudoraea sp.]